MKLIGLLICLLFIFVPMLVLAEAPGAVQNSLDGVNRAQEGAQLPEGNLYNVVGRLIGYLLNIASIILLIVVVYAGITWMTASGNEEGVKKARSMIIQASIGLAVTLSAYALTYYIFARVLGATL